MGWCEGVLLKGSRCVVPRDLAVDAASISPRQTRQAVAANPRHPFDPSSVTDLESRRLCARSKGDNLTYSFMATDLTSLGWVWQDCPSVGHDGLVTVADTRVSHLQQHFANTRLGRLDGFDLGTDLARLVVDDGLVVGWNLGILRGRHCE